MTTASAVSRTSIQLTSPPYFQVAKKLFGGFTPFDRAARVALELVMAAEAQIPETGRNQRGMRSALVHASQTSSIAAPYVRLMVTVRAWPASRTRVPTLRHTRWQGPYDEP